MADRVQAHILVAGRVQGVFYRASTEEAASAYGVDGWVRNLDDGRVEAVFEGSPDAVEAMLSWCHDGPPAARVEGVEAERREPEGLSGFEVRR